jgi:hypothetical protein
MNPAIIFHASGGENNAFNPAFNSQNILYPEKPAWSIACSKRKIRTLFKRRNAGVV